MAKTGIFVVAALLVVGLPCLSSAEGDLGASQGMGEVGRWNASECVAYLGYDTGSFILVYGQGRWGRSGRNGLVGIAKGVSHRKGIGLILVDAGVYSDEEIQLLQCFYGAYSKDNTMFFQEPRLLCPKNGLVSDIYGGSPIMVQMRVFADRCKAG